MSDKRRRPERSHQTDHEPGVESGVSELTYRVDHGLHPTTQKLADSLHVILSEAFETALLKQESYGPYNILRAPGGALNGLRVRLSDKQARWNNMIDNQVTDRVNEPLRDTFMDALNYCAFAVLILDGTFPHQQEEADRDR